MTRHATFVPPEALAAIRESFTGTLKESEPLGQYTTWRIGGPADLLAFPHHRDDIARLLEVSARWRIPLRVLGAGSNLLIADEGCRGIVVKLSGPLAQFSGVVPRGRSMTVQAGGACVLPRLVRETIRRSLRGLEFAEGIPGTVGGACRLNAGAYGETVGDLVESVSGIAPDGAESVLAGSDVSWGYRTTSLPAGFIVLTATFRVHPGSSEEADGQAKSYREQRRRNQPLSSYTAGSVFRNPQEGPAAGKLIDEAGCKGLAVGEAFVSAGPRQLPGQPWLRHGGRDAGADRHRRVPGAGELRGDAGPRDRGVDGAPRGVAGMTGQGLTVGVVMGGWSSEREISLATGNAVLGALGELGRRAVPFDLTRERVTELAAPPFDVAFLSLHGRYGEDGCVQGLLEAAGVPYTGSGVLASAAAMDKPTAKAIFRHHRIPTPPEILLDTADRGAVQAAVTFARRFGWPIVVKPSSEGSSVGVTVVSDPAALPGAIELAAAGGDRVLVERFVEGREITVGILGSTPLPPVEIRPRGGVYSWDAKYTRGMTEYLVPAPVTPGAAAVLASTALRAHRALVCRDYSRVDFRLDPEGRPWVLEINTIPGMTATSLLPKAAAAAGISFRELVGLILDGAISRSGRRA